MNLKIAAILAAGAIPITFTNCSKPPSTPPDWKNVPEPVMTSGNHESDEFQPMAGPALANFLEINNAVFEKSPEEGFYVYSAGKRDAADNPKTIIIVANNGGGIMVASFEVKDRMTPGLADREITKMIKNYGKSLER